MRPAARSRSNVRPAAGSTSCRAAVGVHNGLSIPERFVSERRRRSSMPVVHYRYATVDGHQLFFREAGAPDAPAVVLLHGFPTSSYMFRDLVPALADRYHVIAPDHL